MVSIMTEAHKRAYRHPKDKTVYRVSNWYAYDRALHDRGDITLWGSQNAIDAWMAPKTGKRGAQPVYADIAIETALTLRQLFHLAATPNGRASWLGFEAHGLVASLFRSCHAVET